MPGNSAWQNRIVGSGVKPASDFLAHELNWKIHPRFQQEAIEGSLDQVGWVKSVVESARTGKLLDGHARIILALRHGDDTPVPYEVVDVSEQEEALILATLDPLAALAVAEKEKLDGLMSEISSDNDALNALFNDLMRKSNTKIEEGDALIEERNIGKEFFVTVVLSVEDVETFELALRKTGQQNRGVGMIEICRSFLAGVDGGEKG